MKNETVLILFKMTLTVVLYSEHLSPDQKVIWQLFIPFSHGDAELNCGYNE